MIVRAARRYPIPDLARVHTASALVAYAHVAPPEPSQLERRAANWTAVRRRGRRYVHPDQLGSGAGQLLIETADAKLSRHFGQAVLSVLADNPRARRFFERNGWELEGVQVEPHFGGAPTKIARYRKRFNK